MQNGLPWGKDTPTEMPLQVFALTGGIGSGKSLVSSFWGTLGLPIVDADLLARQVTESGPGLDAITARFGDIGRAELGRLVFGDVRARKDLEAIVHPLVGLAAAAEFARLEAQGHALVCYDVPLLFETGQQDNFRPVVLVSTRQGTQVSRVMARNGLSEEEARARMLSQMPLEEKLPLSDFVIENNGTPEEARAEALRVLDLVRGTLCP